MNYGESVDADIFAPPNAPFDNSEIFIDPVAPYRPIEHYVPAPGDWVKAFIPRLGVTHEGIVVSVFPSLPGIFTGTVAHNMKGAGVVHTDAFIFSEGGKVFFHKRATSDAHVQAIMKRVNASIGKPYDLFGQNCQHFASFAFNGKPESPAVVVGLLALAGLGAFALFKN